MHSETPRITSIVFAILVLLEAKKGLATPTPSPGIPTAQTKVEEKLASQQQKSSTILDTPQIQNTAKQTDLIPTPPLAQTNNSNDIGSKPSSESPPRNLVLFGGISNNNINAEKLKRGLKNFMNSLNPAPYFVPNPIGQQQQQQQQQVLIQAKGSGTSSGLQSSAETAALVNVDPTAEVLIKGPTKQTRPIGGPLRWGRRK